jgi:hypothetical protein
VSRRLTAIRVSACGTRCLARLIVANLVCTCCCPRYVTQRDKPALRAVADESERCRLAAIAAAAPPAPVPSAAAHAGVVAALAVCMEQLKVSERPDPSALQDALAGLERLGASAPPSPPKEAVDGVVGAVAELAVALGPAVVGARLEGHGVAPEVNKWKGVVEVEAKVSGIVGAMVVCI